MDIVYWTIVGILILVVLYHRFKLHSCREVLQVAIDKILLLQENSQVQAYYALEEGMDQQAEAYEMDIMTLKEAVASLQVTLRMVKEDIVILCKDEDEDAVVDIREAYLLAE